MRTRTVAWTARTVVLATASVSLVAVSLAGPPPAGAVTATAPILGRVSTTSSGAQVDNDIPNTTLLSGNGRFVAFTTKAPLIAADTNGHRDAYLRDRVAGTVERVSLTNTEGQIGGDGEVCGLSRDARFVAFVGAGSGLPYADQGEIYLRDRSTKTTTPVSLSSAGVAALPPAGVEVGAVSWSDRCAISDNGRYVAFVSSANNLVSGDGNATYDDVYRRDVQTGTTIRVSVSGAGVAANQWAAGISMTADGNKITFTSDATNLVAADTNSTSDVFLRTVSPAGTQRVSTKTNGAQVVATSGNASITGDGTKVAFGSNSADLVSGDANNQPDVFVKVLSSGALLRASLRSNGEAVGGPAGIPSISDDGTRVVFTATLPPNAPGDANGVTDVYVKNLGSQVLATASAAPNGSTGNGASDWPAISGDGRAVVFRSAAADLVRKDTNETNDVFVRDEAVVLTPFGTTTALVKQQFADFEGRPPTAAELTEWTARLVNGERTPDQVIDDFAHGTTFAGKRAPMIRLYWAFFLRAPDKNGLDYWTKKLTNGASLASVAKFFSASSEFQTKYGSKTNQQFVTLIYQNIFDRDPDPDGLAYWTGKLDSKAKTRGDVMVNFSESGEGKRVLAPQTDTILHVLGMLRTMPSKTYLDLTLSSLKGTWVPQTQVASLRAGSTYASRITP